MADLWDGEADPSEEYIACAGDCCYFTDTYCVIDDSQNLSGEGTGTCRFRVWTAQKAVFYALMTSLKLVILKARQLGISWVVCSYVLWKAAFQGNQVILLFSKGQAEADELLRRIKVLYERLPPSLLELLPKPVGDSKRAFSLSNGSIIRSMPATKSSGVSYTASVVVIDECARTLQASELYTAVKPTIDAGGQIIVFSTAYGMGNLFHSIWSKAVAGKNGFRAIFLPWWTRPGRTAEWYEKIKVESADPKKVAQEYPATALEAFVSSGHKRFEDAWILAHEKNLREPFPASKAPREIRDIPGLRFYAGPDGVSEYLVFCDPAEGIEDGEGDPDYCAVHVFNRRTMEQVCVVHNRTESDVLAGYLIRLGHYYARSPDRPAELVVERNNHGQGVLTALKLAKYRWVATGYDGKKAGWLTNEVTREPSLDQLAAHLRDNDIIIRDRATLDEISGLHVNARGVSKALKGQHDDLVFALAVGLGWLNHGLARKVAMHSQKGPNVLAQYRG